MEYYLLPVREKKVDEKNVNEERKKKHGEQERESKRDVCGSVINKQCLACEFKQ